MSLIKSLVLVAGLSLVFSSTGFAGEKKVKKGKAKVEQSEKRDVASAAQPKAKKNKPKK